MLDNSRPEMWGLSWQHELVFMLITVVVLLAYLTVTFVQRSTHQPST